MFELLATETETEPAVSTAAIDVAVTLALDEGELEAMLETDELLLELLELEDGGGLGVEDEGVYVDVGGGVQVVLGVGDQVVVGGGGGGGLDEVGAAFPKLHSP